LKNTHRGILENAAVFLLGTAKSFDGLLATLRLINLGLIH
jgi:hypothetical protein